MTQPSRALLILAGALTQLVGVACLILNVGSLPFAHDLHAHTHSILAAIVAALATVICGTLVYRARLVPLALAAGLDIGFGIGLPRGNAAVGTLMHVLPKTDADIANSLITGGAITMFVAAILCVLAVPVALRLRAWARAELEREALAARGAEGERAKRMSAAQVVAPIAANTLRGLGPKLMPTQVIRLGGRRGKPIVVAAVAVSVIAIGIVVITAAGARSAVPSHAVVGGRDAAIVVGAGSAAIAAPVGDAGAGPSDPAVGPPPDPPVEEILARLHLALVHAKPDELGLLFDEHAFAFGVEAHEIAEGRAAVVALVQHDLGTVPAGGFEVSPRFTQSGHAADTGWIAEELRLGGKTYVTTAVVDLRDGAWSIAALQLATTMTNAEAHRAARDGELAMPDAIPDTHDASHDAPLAKAMRAGFASKPSFVAARSARGDALNVGSAPGERILGGENIKKLFSKLKATIRLHDAVKVGPAGAHGGWGAANVDFTDADRDGAEVTQTFRVLVAWVEEASGWRMVQSQWSNAR
jgi:hypothetical protein